MENAFSSILTDYLQAVGLLGLRPAPLAVEVTLLEPAWIIEGARDFASVGEYSSIAKSKIQCECAGLSGGRQA